MKNTQNTHGVSHLKVTDNMTNIRVASVRVEKTENILSAVLLLTSSLNNNFKNENRDANIFDKSLKILIGKTEAVVYEAANNFYNDKTKIKDNLQAIVFYINALKLKGIISDDNHMSLIIAYSTVISAFETLETRGVAGDIQDTSDATNNIRDIDLKLEEVEELEDFKMIHSPHNIDMSKNTNQEEKREERNVKDKNEDNKSENKIKVSAINNIKDTQKTQTKDNAKDSGKKEIKNTKDTQNSEAKKHTDFDFKKLDTVLSRNIRDIVTASDSINKRQDSRRNEILRLLSSTPITIKDISEKVLGCSEKTIQRELNSMLDDNVIERVGEKRWSKYKLA